MPRLLVVETLRFLGLGPIDLAIAAGECVSLSGPSGAGKTLLLRAIADLDLSEGRVLLDDIERNDIPAPEWRRQVGLLFSESAWWGERVGAHFANPASELLCHLGFPSDTASWSVARLSSGEKQRLALARMLAIGPRVLLLDEATANLDTENTARVETLIETYRRDHDAAVLWVSHDPQQAARVATRQLYISDGRLHSTRPGLS